MTDSLIFRNRDRLLNSEAELIEAVIRRIRGCTISSERAAVRVQKIAKRHGGTVPVPDIIKLTRAAADARIAWTLAEKLLREQWVGGDHD